jgi:hypothetical protein
MRVLILALGTSLALAASAQAASPETSITAGPEGPTAKKAAKYSFESSASGSSFECRLDAKKWVKCDSPTKYAKLKTGEHIFEVRAKKGRKTDPTPAFREFEVDLTPPETTVTAGPEGEIEVHTATYEFFSNDADATFECRFTPDSDFDVCFSPFTTPTELPDGAYEFQVRATDPAGNADKSPATREFNVESPLRKTEETGVIASAIYFPDIADIDAPASCGGNPEVDCPNGQPLPPADQLRLTSSRSGVWSGPSSRYDLTVTLDVETLQAVKMKISGIECDVTFTSANGTIPTWQVQVPLNFQIEASTGDFRIVPGSIGINNFEQDDVEITGGFSCAFANFGTAPFGSFVDWLSDTMVGYSLCAAPGPEYLGPCPPPPGP